jgi:HrpA-like RNA helicase
VFITTRYSNFKGDYPVEVLGMSETEADQLINETASNLGIKRLIARDYRRELYRESDGQPYVMKILLAACRRSDVQACRGSIFDFLPREEEVTRGRSNY